MNPYESEKLVSEYLLFHYGSADEILGGLPGPAEATGFAARLVRELLDTTSLPPNARALDVGCAVGGSTFELARTCASVLGIDSSHAFIAAANTLQHRGLRPFDHLVEGEITASAVAEVAPGIDRSLVTFEHGDAMNLKPKITDLTFDIVLAANLLCRLPDPRKFLDQLPDLIAPGSQLLLTTPFTWLEEFTPKSKWIGGRKRTGRGLDVLEKLLIPHFDLEHTADIPFLIREHARKFQYTIALGTRWRRREF